MTTTRTFIAALVLLAASPALAGPERDYNEPPPGASAEDAKLWRDLRHGTSWAIWQLARVAQCSRRIQYGKYYEVLDATIRTGDSQEAPRATALRERLEAAARRAQDAIPADGGRVHPCRLTLLDLDQRIDPRNVEVANERDAFRAEAQACADRLNRLIDAVQPAADGLERALNDIDVYLKRAAPPPPAGEPDAEPPPKA